MIFPACTPPLLRGEDEIVEGGLLVAELGEAAGVAVWRALRDARGWRSGELPGDARGRLRALRDLRLPPELWAPLAVLACLGDGIGADDEARLLHACRQIARWAEANRAWRTALAWEALIAALWPRRLLALDSLAS
jgi:hypothetical protein